MFETGYSQDKSFIHVAQYLCKHNWARLTWVGSNSANNDRIMRNGWDSWKDLLEIFLTMYCYYHGDDIRYHQYSAYSTSLYLRDIAEYLTKDYTEYLDCIDVLPPQILKDFTMVGILRYINSRIPVLNI